METNDTETKVLEETIRSVDDCAEGPWMDDLDQAIRTIISHVCWDCSLGEPCTFTDETLTYAVACRNCRTLRLLRELLAMRKVIGVKEARK